MKVDISDILKINGASVRLDFEEEPLEREPVKGYEITGGLSFSGTLANYDGILRLDGYLKTGYMGECCRCLRKVDGILEIRIREDFSGKAGSEPDMYAYEGKVLDIGKALYDNIVLNLPMKLLCSDECRGFCGRCGASLNEGKCGCGENEVDPRWEGLGRLLGHS